MQDFFHQQYHWNLHTSQPTKEVGIWLSFISIYIYQHHLHPKKLNNVMILTNGDFKPPSPSVSLCTGRCNRRPEPRSRCQLGFSQQHVHLEKKNRSTSQKTWNMENRTYKYLQIRQETWIIVQSSWCNQFKCSKKLHGLNLGTNSSNFLYSKTAPRGHGIHLWIHFQELLKLKKIGENDQRRTRPSLAVNRYIRISI